MWWAREDSNLQPSGYERAELAGKASDYWHFRARPVVSVRIWLRHLLVIYWSYQINRRKFTRGSSEADEIDRARQWAGEITERSLRHFPPSIGAPRGKKIKKKISPEPRQAIPLPTQVLQPRTRQYCERPLRCSWPLILTFRDRYIGYRTDPVPVCGKRRIECRLRCLGKRR